MKYFKSFVRYTILFAILVGAGVFLIWSLNLLLAGTFLSGAVIRGMVGGMVGGLYFPFIMFGGLAALYEWLFED